MSDDVKNLIKKCVYYLKLNKLGRAKKCSLKAIALAPRNAYVFNSIGKAYFEAKNFIKALNYFSNAIYIDDKNCNFYNNKGGALFCLEKYEEALNFFNKAIELNANKINQFQNKGLCLMHLEKYEEAIETYNKAIRLNSRNSDDYIFKGIAHRFLKQFSEAMKSISTGFRFVSKDGVLNFNAGIIMYEAKLYEIALEYFNRAIELKPYFDLNYFYLSKTLIHKNKLELALIKIDEAISLNQKAKYYNLKATILCKSKKYDLAYADAIKALDSNDSFNYFKKLM